VADPKPSAVKAIQSIRDFELKGQKVLIRVDFNVPLSEPDAEGHRKVEDDTRIREAVPTIRFAIDAGAKVILASHLGRPKGKPDAQYSMEPAALHLAELLGVEVTLADACVGDGIELMAKNLKNGQVLMLENLRFHPGEEACDPQFCAELSRLCDIYINDAFGTSHRKHASVYGLPKIVEKRGMGFLIEKELKHFDAILKAPKKPFFLVLGGAKVGDKIKTIEALLPNIDGMVVGGAMAYAFMQAKEWPLPMGAKTPSQDDVTAARSILREAEKREIPVKLPEDFVASFDIGTKTVASFSTFLDRAKTIFWNGPMGWFEKPEYAKGTMALVENIARITAVKIVGGGDTVSAINQSGLAEKFDHLSTGGGASLEYLEGNGLPGTDILKTYARPKGVYLSDFGDDEE
jgi:phosphoglycerate kinase